MRKLTLAILLLSFLAPAISIAQDSDSVKLKPEYYEVNPFVDDNEGCLKCHGEHKFVIEDPVMGKTVTEAMCEERYIDRDLYYQAVHKSFSCTDCHSYDYFTFPHSLDSRLEERFVCMDCHGYDETYAHYNFETIEVEFQASIHNIEGFTCWKCHNPHSYKAFVRNAEDIEEAVLYDNNMCLRCHADFTRFMVLTDRSEINIVDRHDWLPNQASHFANVRCIECHTQINDTILVAHKILPKEQAVKKCTECHSKDSRLLHSLYKFTSQEGRKGGFVNGVILNNSYVIGANQNVILNRLSILVFGLVLVVVLYHIILRIRKQ